MIDQLPPIALRRFPIVDTSSRDDMRDALVLRYGASDFDLRQTDEQFRGIGNLLQLKDIALGYCNYSADVRVAFPGLDGVRQHYALSGSGQVAAGRSQFQVSPNETGVVPAGTEAHFSFSKSFSMVTLRLDERALRVKLSALIGMPVGRSIEFSPTATFRESRAIAIASIRSIHLGRGGWRTHAPAHCRVR